MHQRFEDDYTWEVVDQPLWLSRLADDLATHSTGGWTNQFYIDRALKILGMLEIDQILAPILCHTSGPVQILWPKGNHEKLEVKFNRDDRCHVRIKSMHTVIFDQSCTVLELRHKLLEFYPYVKGNFDRLS